MADVQITARIMMIKNRGIQIVQKQYHIFAPKRRLPNRCKNKLIQSVALSAAAKDNFADALITSMTLLSLIDLPSIAFPLDGLVGLIIAVFILWTGITSFIENMSLLLGKSVDADLLKEVERTILAYDIFSGIQTLEIHDYGPEARRAMIQVSLNQRFHVEQVQDIQKEVCVELKEKFDLDATLYWTDHQEKNEQHIGEMGANIAPR